MTNHPTWFIQKGQRILGPYSPEVVRTLVRTGNLSGTERVTQDSECWEPLSQVPELVPVHGADMRMMFDSLGLDVKQN